MSQKDGESASQQLRAVSSPLVARGYGYQIKNLDAAEQKCDKLTALLRSLNPDVDIETLLKKWAFHQWARGKQPQPEESGTGG